MRIIGLDVGTKTVGVALSDALGWTAQGLETIAFNDENKSDMFSKLVSLINMHEARTVVVGYPKNMNGTIGESGRRSETFAKMLREHVDVQVVLWDERLTTAAATRVLVDADVSRKKRKKVIDKMAAVLILQSYLDHASHRPTSI
ncbi:Holliday junction resolvase RuvX [Bacillus sp. FSL W7-1360]